jgi:hypothetical protein
VLAQKLDKLTLNSSLADPPRHDFQVSETTLGLFVEKEFKRYPELPGVVITADCQIVGMISRTQFCEWLSRPYGLETFLRRLIKSPWRMIADAEGIGDGESLLTKYLVLRATCSSENRSFNENRKKAQSTSSPLLPAPYFLSCEVEDTGLSIAPEEKNTLFTPFGQTENRVVNLIQLAQVMEPECILGH